MTRQTDNRPLRARQITQQPDPALDPDQRPHDMLEAIARWEAHVDAGRIGTRVPPDPHVAENLARTDALFRSFQRGTRA
jgi:hypothetical protein